MIRINTVFQYVFGQWAYFNEKAVRQHLDQQTRLTGDKASKLKDAHEKFIRRARVHFNNALQDEHLSVVFRTFLQPRNAALEQILFTETAEPLTSDISISHAVHTGTEVTLPSDAQIMATFEALNHRYPYFDQNGGAFQKTQEKFIVFYQACGLVAKFIEKTCFCEESPYKLLALFNSDQSKGTPFDCFETYLRRHNFNTHPTPVHHALSFNLPVKGDFDIQRWKTLIQTLGPLSTRLFEYATQITDRPDRKTPRTLNEMLRKAAYVRYPHAKTYPALAMLCCKYGVSEAGFNQCLALDGIRKKNKETDNLPDILVHGIEINPRYARYHLLKLPADEPRVYVLGHFNNSCQPIEGDATQCVVDGATRKNNGFYILMKRTANTEQPVRTNNWINHRDFQIVGGGYAWISAEGNLTFDSWENLRPRTDQPVVQALLKKFAQRVIQTGAILRVTIGAGRETFKEIGPPTQDIEIIREGSPYADAATQYVVDENEAFKAQCLTQMRERLKTVASGAHQMLAPLLAPEQIHSLHRIELIEHTVALALEHDTRSAQETLQALADFPEPAWRLLGALKDRNLLNWTHITSLEQASNLPTLKTLYYKLPLLRDLFPVGLMTLTQALDIMASDCPDLIAAVLSNAGVQTLIQQNHCTAAVFMKLLKQDIGMHQPFLNAGFQQLVQIGIIDIGCLENKFNALSERACCLIAQHLTVPSIQALLRHRLLCLSQLFEISAPKIRAICTIFNQCQPFILSGTLTSEELKILLSFSEAQLERAGQMIWPEHTSALLTDQLLGLAQWIQLASAHHVKMHDLNAIVTSLSNTGVQALIRAGHCSVKKIIQLLGWHRDFHILLQNSAFQSDIQARSIDLLALKKQALNQLLKDRLPALRSLDQSLSIRINARSETPSSPQPLASFNFV